MLTQGLSNSDDVDGRRTTRSSTRGSTAASKLKNEPPAKKERKTPVAKGGNCTFENVQILLVLILLNKSLGKRGRPRTVTKEENDEVVSAEENGVTENDVDSKADKGGSSTEEEVDSKTEEKVENGDSSIEEEKKDEEVKYYTVLIINTSRTTVNIEKITFGTNVTCNT